MQPLPLSRRSSQKRGISPSLIARTFRSEVKQSFFAYANPSTVHSIMVDSSSESKIFTAKTVDAVNLVIFSMTYNYMSD